MNETKRFYTAQDPNWEEWDAPFGANTYQIWDFQVSDGPGADVVAYADGPAMADLIVAALNDAWDAAEQQEDLWREGYYG